MKTQPVFKQEILYAFNESFPNGRKVFDRLLNEEVLVEVLVIMGPENLDLYYVDRKGSMSCIDFHKRTIWKHSNIFSVKQNILSSII